MLPATYSDLGYLSIYENSKSIYLLGKDKKGSVLIDAKNYKPISPIYESIELINSVNKLFIVKEKNQEYIYQINKGILEEIGNFDTHIVFPRYDNIYILKKGNQSSIFNKDDLSKTNYISGDIVDNFNYSQYLITENKKYGLIGIEGNILIPKEYDTLINTSGTEICLGFIAAKKQNKWGVVKDNGTVTIPLEYEAIDFSLLRKISGLVDSCLHAFPIKLNGKWGFVNEENKMVIAPQYDSILSYINPLRFAAIKNGNNGLIDLKGNILFPFNYKYFELTNNFSGEPTSEKYYFVNNTCIECNPLETEGGWGLADSTGKLLQELNASLIPLRDYNKLRYENFDSSNYGFLWNIGGQKMKEIISIDSVWNEQFDNGGNEILSYHMQYEYSYFFKGGKTGIVNNKGEITLSINNEDLILPLYNNKGVEPMPSSDLVSLNQKNRAYSSMYNLTRETSLHYKQNKKWGISNLKGKVIIPCEFDSIQDYSLDKYDLNDSALNSLNLPFEQYICFKEGNKYFYRTNGVFIAKHLESEKIIGETFYSKKIENNSTQTVFEPLQVITRNPIDKFIQIVKKQIEYELMDEYGQIYSDTFEYTKHLYIPETKNINFYKPLTGKYIFEEPIEDFIMSNFSTNTPPSMYTWNNTSDKLYFLYNHGYDEIIKTYYENGNYSAFNNPRNYQNIEYYDSLIFIKQNNKWYLRNLNEPNFKNKIGFDSVYVNSNNTFIAYNNGSFATYNFNEINFDKTKIDFVFPDYGEHRLACSSCEYSYVEKKTKTPQFSFDAEGNEIQGDTVHSITRIPLITKGKLNITNKYCVPLFEEWVDEIILPTSAYTNNNINLSNKNDSLFNQPFIYDYELSGIYNAKTIAYRIDKTWYLSTLDETKKTLGPFESIEHNGKYWEAIKSGTSKTFNVTNLTEGEY